MATHKSWVLTAVSKAGTAVTYLRHGEVLFGGGGEPGAVSPVEFLLVAAAGCLALSCRAVLVRRNLAAASVEVVATGDKAADAPSRLARITLAVRFGTELTVGAEVLAAEAGAIVAEAEHLCTVSNTLLGAPSIEAHAAPISRIDT